MLSVKNHGIETQSRDLEDPQVLLATLQDIRQSVYQEGQEIFSQWEPHIQRHSFIKSAENLAYYVALQHHDLRSLQTALTPWGLSSLGRIEARVLPNLDAVISTLGNICSFEPDSLPSRPFNTFFFRRRISSQTSYRRCFRENLQSAVGKNYGNIALNHR